MRRVEQEYKTNYPNKIKDFKFQTDYAKSDRSSCKLCKASIAKDSLRLATLAQAPKFDGKIPLWYHFGCFFNKAKAAVDTSGIKNFDNLRWADQEKIRQKINNLKETLASTSYNIKISSVQVQCSDCKLSVEKGTTLVSNKTNAYHISCFLKGNDVPGDITTLAGYKKLKKDVKKTIEELATSLSQPRTKLRASIQIF
ncbi:unnamed protein product [Protopolystoma xenopodis]|uniref:PARP-type domain-containing protein n=1 Tax=Protopolystoma xenopodis TaxID=117903 RepID=A0A3S5AQJ1_9PLAT|nr:unnamed protein product [Protopolystoma xenopodis]